jgi:hypothetical protein
MATHADTADAGAIALTADIVFEDDHGRYWVGLGDDAPGGVETRNFAADIARREVVHVGTA